MVSWNRTNLGSSSRGTNFAEELYVGLVVVSPLGRQVIFVVNGLYRAYWLTGTSVHTLIWVDVEHAVTLVNTVNWALGNTGLVLDIHTGQRDNVSQLSFPLLPQSIISLQMRSV